jgi:hypothetical protein
MSKINASSYFNTPSALGGYTISQSLRFNDGDSPQLSRTPSSAGNQKTWTFSCWVKRGNLGSTQTIFSGGTGSTLSVEIRFGSGDKIEVLDTNNSYLFITSAVFRDTSAWYHIVIENDTTQATVNDRTKLYVNGEQITSFSTDNRSNFSQNEDTAINSTNVHYIGRWINGGQFFDGYMSEIHLVDGTARDADDFGVLENGIWLPKFYEGSHGTNGFYMPFDDSSDIGADRSANGNDFTSSNLASTDVVLDSPTNNFPTILPDKGGTAQVYSEGNLHANISSNSYAAKSSMFVPMDSGKWYVEALSDATSGSGAGLGTYTPDSINTLSSVSYYYTGNIVLATDLIHYYSSGSIYNEGSSSQSSLTTVGDKDIIGMLIDTDAKTVQFYVNGTASGTAETMANTTDPVAAQLHGHNSRPFMFNFGTDSSFANRKTSGSANATDANGIGDFYYTPPAGAKAICSKNLPEPSISPINGEQPADYFNTVLYTGDGSSSRSLSGVNFQPDFIWLKDRNTGYQHSLQDSVRGTGASKKLYSSLTEAEGGANSVYGHITSFDSDGFSVATGTGGAQHVNQNTVTYVAWNWLAGGTAVSNTDGSITSSVSANTKAGFSIVSYTGNNTAGATVGHGLDSAPEMIFIKGRVATGADGNWNVYAKPSGGVVDETDYLLLNSITSADDNAGAWNDTAATSSVFSLGTFADSNGNGKTFIAYCFHSVEGYSKVGSYTGNGGSDGTYVYTGFRPAWVMSKRTSGTGYWNIFDVERDVNDSTGKQLFANDSSSEASSSGNLIDILSNGFKMRGTGNDTNASGSDYIYIAFAEQPFKYSNAR